jgi:hypothetical protein
MPDQQQDQPDFEAMSKLVILEDEKFKEFVRSHHKFTLERLKDDPRQGLTPELVVLTRDMDLKEEIVFIMIAVDFNESKVKHQIMFNAAVQIYEMKKVPVAIVLAFEAWCAKRSKDTDYQNVQPRHDPMRFETIMVVGAGLEKKQRLTIMTPIIRDKDSNNIVVNGEPEEFDGPMMFLLDHFWRGFFSRAMGRGTGKESKP